MGFGVTRESSRIAAPASYERLVQRFWRLLALGAKRKVFALP